ncbi:MarR family winged helix-turn-helix transcriptional regulator [Saccharothrix syringae]|nr:MarR family transcriptional regulator [Saccharothrix syringae]
MHSDETVPAVDDMLCFALYAASRAVTSAYRPLLQELGLTYPQFLVMQVLWRHGAISVKELGDHLQLDYGTLTPLLKRLEAAGLVTRRRRADDERSVEVGLTEEGRALRGSTTDIPVAIGEAMGLTEDEVDRLRLSLRQLTDNVVAHGTTP